MYKHSMIYLNQNTLLCFMQEERDRGTFLCWFRCRYWATLAVLLKKRCISFSHCISHSSIIHMTIFSKVQCNGTPYAKLSPLFHLHQVQCYTFNLQSSVSMALGYFSDCLPQNDVTFPGSGLGNMEF